MKIFKLLLVIVFCVFFQQSEAQKITPLKKRTVKQPNFKIGRLNPHLSDDDCVFTNTYSVAQRLKRYPFYRATKIVAVSFLGIEPYKQILINGNSHVNDTLKKKTINKLTKNVTDTIFKAGLHIKNCKLNYSSIIEIKELNSNEICNLTNVIYNTNVHKPSNYSTPGYNCFIPRNALIFYDRNGKIFDYLEVCFECMHYMSESHKITIGTYCNQKYDLLKDLFIDAGIKYGTNQ
jgi:acetyltransferase-like isoleucine patch superfamily enzyme